MFGLFRHRNARVRSLTAGMAAVPPATFERLLRLIYRYGGSNKLSAEGQAVLMQWAANPPAWSNPLPDLDVLGIGALTGWEPEPLPSMATDPSAIPSNSAESGHATGGSIW